jgi:putative transposase
MPRGARLVVPDVAMHIVQRGHDRRDCFRHDTDYLVYLANLRDLSKQTGCALHAYCLMTNHVHLLLTPSSAQACARLMRNLGQRYVQYFNRRYQRSGTLWEGRFRSCLVDSAPYVIACHRYIERNPVRAGMVSSTAEYRWSSYDGNAGLAANALLTPHVEYLALSNDDRLRHAAYQDLFGAEEDQAFLAAIRDATNGGFALVGERLKSILPADAQQRLERKLPGPRAKPKEEPDHASGRLQIELGLRPRTS